MLSTKYSENNEETCIETHTHIYSNNKKKGNCLQSNNRLLYDS